MSTRILLITLLPIAILIPVVIGESESRNFFRYLISLGVLLPYIVDILAS
jgi:hypothetical protein